MVLHARKTGFGFPRSARDWHRLARWMMPLGAVTILLGLGFGVRTLRFVRRARRTTGTIVQLIQGSSSQSGTVYTPVFTFTDAEGRTHRVISRVASYPPAGLVGDTVPVLYDPRDPSRARIDRFFDLWGLPAVLTGTGLFHVILFGIIAAASARKMRRAGLEVPADDASPSPHHSDFARSSSDPDGN